MPPIYTYENLVELPGVLRHDCDAFGRGSLKSTHLLGILSMIAMFLSGNCEVSLHEVCGS